MLRAYRRKNREIPIIVEGRNDLRCLKKLDFRGDIIVFNSGKSITAFADSISPHYNEVIILTDFDQRGKFLKDRLYQEMMGLGIRIDISLWNYINKHVPIKTVEELPAEFYREKYTEISKTVLR
ncbi:MAG: toprim domain-containing protein [Thermoplasmata archaeon]